MYIKDSLRWTILVPNDSPMRYTSVAAAWSVNTRFQSNKISRRGYAKAKRPTYFPVINSVSVEEVFRMMSDVITNEGGNEIVTVIVTLHTRKTKRNRNRNFKKAPSQVSVLRLTSERKHAFVREIRSSS